MSKSNSLFPLILGLIVALALVGGAVFLLFQQSPEPELSSSESEESEESSEESSASSTPESSLPEESAESSEESSESEESTSEESKSESSEASHKPEEADVPGASSSQSEASQSSRSSAAASQSSQSSASQSSTPDDAAAGTVNTSGFTYPDKVPESAEVDNSWFDDAMFVGDSITEGIKAYNLMSNTTVISNVGINLSGIINNAVINTGDGTRITIPQAMKQHPDAKKIYILMGANGLSWMTQEVFLSYYRDFLDLVKAQHPNATIYVISIFPINETKFYNNYKQDTTNQKIDTYNNALMQLAVEENVKFLYVAEALKEPNGSLSADVSGDGLHIGPNYYQRWFTYLRKHTGQ